MCIQKEIRLRDFEFWGGAKEFASKLRPQELDDIEESLEIYFADMDEVPTETRINDIFWFDQEWVINELGLWDVESVMNRPDFD